MKTITRIIVLLILTGWGNVIFAQASSWSEFKITVEFNNDIPIEDVDVSYYKKSGNWFDRIGIERDSVSNQITISGQNEYITLVSFTTLVFTLSERTIDVRTNDSINMTTQFFLFTNGLESFDEERIDLKVIKFTKDKPCVLINGIRRPDKYNIIRTDINGLLTDTRFDHVFFSNEIVEIDDL